VESQYYRIYLIGEYGFIVMKEPAPVKRLRWWKVRRWPLVRRPHLPVISVSRPLQGCHL